MKMTPRELDQRMDLFRSRCLERGLALTHQRWVIYRILAGTDKHLTPEAAFGQVRKQIPSISLATVYKNIKTFLEVGLLQEVGTSGQMMRLDANLEPHHHLVCVRCKAIQDLSAEGLRPVRLKGRLPKGFRVERFNVTFLGLCGQCSPRYPASTRH